MSIHTIIVLILLYAAFRAAIRPRQADLMAGRLVHSTEEQRTDLHAWRKEQHDTFSARHTVDFRTQPATAAAPIKPGHYLKAYWPKDEPMPESWQ
jgi:hypothetical protein